MWKEREGGNVEVEGGRRNTCGKGRGGRGERKGSEGGKEGALKEGGGGSLITFRWRMFPMVEGSSLIEFPLRSRNSSLCHAPITALIQPRHGGKCAHAGRQSFQLVSGQANTDQPPLLGDRTGWGGDQLGREGEEFEAREVEVEGLEGEVDLLEVADDCAATLLQDLERRLLHALLVEEEDSELGERPDAGMQARDGVAPQLESLQSGAGGYLLGKDRDEIPLEGQSLQVRQSTELVWKHFDLVLVEVEMTEGVGKLRNVRRNLRDLVVGDGDACECRSGVNGFSNVRARQTHP
eukprot:766168-Hanusia_phi.AAC.1